MIEAAIYERETAPDEYGDIAILRFAGPLLVVLDDDWFLSKAVEEIRQRSLGFQVPLKTDISDPEFDFGFCHLHNLGCL